MANKNYIIGKAEELTSIVPAPKMRPNNNAIYTLNEVISRLEPQLKRVVDDMKGGAPVLTPEGYSVAKLTMHPSYLSKGHFPTKLMRSIDLESLGSRSETVTPDKWTRKGEPKASPTTGIFVAGKVSAFEALFESLKSVELDDPGVEDLMRVWSFEVVQPKDKLKLDNNRLDSHFEVVFQLMPSSENHIIEKLFYSFAEELGFEIAKNYIVSVSNLLFIPIFGSVDNLEILAKHPFVRVIRNVSRLRSYKPLVSRMAVSESPDLPREPAIAGDIKVAILDGGISNDCVMRPWVNNYILSNPNGLDDPDAVAHGVAVTSAFLFGSIDPNLPIERPFAPVDHYRVLDNETDTEDPYELYKTLGYIEEVLLSNQYDFINLSLGPEYPVDDDEIHPWTSLIDSHIYDSNTLVCIAAGNNGNNDAELGLNRVQVPADSVNSIAVGSANSSSALWERARYSAVGPGRSPGVVKPDLLAFGGDPKEYFHVLDGVNPANITPQLGTSFASPYLLRRAVGIKALMGESISPIAIKAILVNSAEKNGLNTSDVGWGRIPAEIESLLESPLGTARILYQGELKPGKYMKAPLPLPKGGLKGKVIIKATCCFVSPVDPQDSSMYTKSGVEISWCPNSLKKQKESFFKQEKKATEAELRRDAAKWETVLHEELPKMPKALNNPYFEIHHMARDSGATISSNKAKPVKYAFVITLECPKHKEIFSEILNDYDVLTELKPRVQIPAKVNV